MTDPRQPASSPRIIDNIWIPLSDGCRLSARVWLPAHDRPAPAVLEYLPYRKDDITADQDATRHPYFAEHGFAAVRVDLRGTGDSDGVLLGEYLEQEQDDALEVIAWIARQPWSSGTVGMIGYSWGGFNGLQVAARRPPALKAVITVHSTDDRYRDDCHYMGGCLLASDMLKWSTTMRAYMALPPDPRVRRDWREVWLGRLEQTPPFVVDWLSHQRRDGFWRHGSVAEDYSAIQAATLVVGGWADAYTNAVGRLLENLTCERKAIIGPWGHYMPYLPGSPGPAIGFLQECVRWFGRWLADKPTGVEDDPMLRFWMQDGVAPARSYTERPGEWLEVAEWPRRDVRTVVWRLDAGSRLVRLGPDIAVAPAEGVVAPESRTVEVTSPQQVGRTAGVWCANGLGDEFADDQRDDDALSATFDSAVLEAPLEVLGTPVLRLTLSADRPRALVAARLCEVDAEGASTLVSWGMLNLARREGDDTTRPLAAGESYVVKLRLHDIGHRFGTGSRVRVSLSPTYWPHAWPSPEPAALSVRVGGPSTFELPSLGDARPLELAFGEPESAPPADSHASGSRKRVEEVDPAEQSYSTIDREAVSMAIPPLGTRFRGAGEDHYSISADDPLSALTRSTREWSLEREGWRVRVVADDALSGDASSFHVDTWLRVYDDDDLVHERRERFDIDRDGL